MFFFLVNYPDHHRVGSFSVCCPIKKKHSLTIHLLLRLKMSTKEFRGVVPTSIRKAILEVATIPSSVRKLAKGFYIFEYAKGAGPTVNVKANLDENIVVHMFGEHPHTRHFTAVSCKGKSLQWVVRPRGSQQPTGELIVYQVTRECMRSLTKSYTDKGRSIRQVGDPLVSLVVWACV